MTHRIFLSNRQWRWISSALCWSMLVVPFTGTADQFSINKTNDISHLYVCLELGRYDEALDILSAWLRDDPANIDYKYLTGVLRVHQKKYAKAEIILREVIAADPLTPGAYFYLGEIKLAQKNLQAAAEYFTEALEFDEFDNESHFNLATIALFQHDYDRSIIHYAHVLTQSPGAHDALLGLMHASAGKGLCTKITKDAPEGQALFRIDSTQTSDKPLRPQTIMLVHDGLPNMAYVKKLGFYGAALGQHKQGVDFIELRNGGFTDWASMGLDIAHPMDARHMSVTLSLQGTGGGEESVLLNMRDAASAPDSIPISLGPVHIETQDMWQDIQFSLDDAADKIDLSQLAHIGIEFGSATVRNKKGAQLRLQDITIQ